MTSDPSHHENRDSVIRVKAGEDYVNFIYQFVKYTDTYTLGQCVENSSRHILMSTSPFIIGPPTKFPNYGDFSEMFVMRTCTFNISTSPWLKEPDLPHMYKNLPKSDSNRERMIHRNYLDLQFSIPVYPIRVSIYEVYNPGHVIQILAKKYPSLSDNRWYSLWSGPPQTVASRSRIFSPPLRTCKLKINMLRLRFKNSVWDCKTKLDAVRLIGTAELIFPKNMKSLTDLLKSINCNYPCHSDIHNLTPDCEGAQSDISNFQMNFSEYCTIRKSDFDSYNSWHNYLVTDLVTDHSNCVEFKKMNITEVPSDEFKEQSSCSFSSLSDEVILKILNILDMRSLCRMSRVNKRLNNLTRDRTLFKCLNLRNLYQTKLISIDNIVCYFASRCEYLQQLDLTSSNVSISHFEKFLNVCGCRLTHLRLRNAHFVKNIVLLKISRTCKNLKVLDLSLCEFVTDKGFSYLENLNFLEDLNFSQTDITTKSLCKILRKNCRIRNLNLANVNRYKCILDVVIIQLRDSCPDLEILNLSFGIVTSRGIDALAECKNLRKLSIRGFKIVNDVRQNLCKLFSSCQCLEEINLLSLGELYYGDHNICGVDELSLCKNLKQIVLHYRPDFETVELLLINCPNLQTIRLTWSYFQTSFIAKLREKYPHLSIESIFP